MKRIIEKYNLAFTAENFKKELVSSMRSLQRERTPTSLLNHLNRIGFKYNISFSDEEQWGHVWSYNDVGIQLGYILENGTIVIVCDPKALIDNVFLNNFIYFTQIVTSIVNHELIHRNQLKNTPRNYRVTRRDLRNTDSNDSYLSNAKEIDAHAAQAVSEFLEIGYTKEEIRNWLTSTQKLKSHAAESNAFWKYWDFYGQYSKDDTQGVWKRFLTRFYDFLQQNKY